MANNVITWDEIEKRMYEMGVSKGVIYRLGTDGTYNKAEAWNGLINVTEKPSGADSTKLWADNMEYAALRAAETFEGSIEAYMYPDLFAECDGMKEIATGVWISQQTREVFGMCYRTEIGSAAKGQNAGYKLHMLYGLTASPSEKSHDTINDSPDAATMSWDVEGTAVTVEGFKPTACLSVSSLDVDADTMRKLEDVLYGTETTPARLPLPNEVGKLVTVVVVPEEDPE